MNQAISFETKVSDELIDSIAEKVIDKLKPLLSIVPTKGDDIIFDVKGLADYLKSTEAWVREQARNGTIPCFKSGKYWKFRKKDIDKRFPSRPLIVSH